MTEKDIRSLSKEDAIDRLLQFYSDEYKISMYLVLTEKMQKIAEVIDNLVIQEDEDVCVASIEELLEGKEPKASKAKNNFLKNVDLIKDFTKDAYNLSESLDKIREKIDKEALRKAKEERTKAKSGTVEDLIKRVNNAKS